LLRRRGEIARRALILFKERKVRFAPGLAQHDTRTTRKTLGMNVATRVAPPRGRPNNKHSPAAAESARGHREPRRGWDAVAPGQ
jgi:hypothetical protein